MITNIEHLFLGLLAIYFLHVCFYILPIFASLISKYLLIAYHDTLFKPKERVN